MVRRGRWCGRGGRRGRAAVRGGSGQEGRTVDPDPPSRPGPSLWSAGKPAQQGGGGRDRHDGRAGQHDEVERQSGRGPGQQASQGVHLVGHGSRSAASRTWAGEADVVAEVADHHPGARDEPLLGGAFGAATTNRPQVGRHASHCRLLASLQQPSVCKWPWRSRYSVTRIGTGARQRVARRAEPTLW
jgi:hypothetical protein